MSLQLVKNEPPNFIQALEEALDLARNNKMSCLVLGYVIDDKVFTDYVKADGTSLMEMIGCVEIIRTELVDAMRV